MKKLIIILFIISGISLGIFFLPEKKENQQKFKIEKITRGDIESFVSATGTVNAVTTILVGTQVSGTIKEIYVDFNTMVKKNQIIAQIDPATFEAQVEQAKANLFSAKANLEKAKVAVVDAKRTLERNSKLYSENIVSKRDFDLLETNYELAKAQAKVQEAQIAQNEASLKIAEINLKNTNIISPVDGIVISRNVNVGQTVAASFQTPTLFTIAEDLTKMQIDTNVDEADIGKITNNQVVSFTVDSYPETVFKGLVAQIRIAPITLQNVVTYDVVILVENTDFKLKPGMTANVDISVASKKNILKVSNAALRFKPEEKENQKEPNQKEAKGAGVWILENEKLKRIIIKLGITDKSYTGIISNDIKEGQDIIVESVRTKKSTGPALRFF